MNQTEYLKPDPRKVPAANKKFSIAGLLTRDGKWKVLGFTIESWVFAFLVALAIPYVNIIAIPFMFFAFAGALAVYSVWALLNMG